jgi:hypothetical protein
MFKLTISAFILSAMLSSCGKAHCGKASFTLGLIKFTDAESDTIIVKRFNKGTNFSSLHDSVFVDKLNSQFQRSSDTIIVYYYTSEGQLLTEDYDHEIVLPGSPRVFRLADIAYTNEYEPSGEKVMCIAKIDSYKIDGQLKNPSNQGNFIFITK